MKQFSRYLQQKNISKSTIEKYIQEVEKYEKWLSISIELSEKKDLLNYLKDLNDRGVQNRTRQHKLGILRHYYSFLYQQDKITHNPTNLIKIRGTKRKILYQILTIEQMDEFIDLYNAEYPSKIREQIILSLIIYQGLQVSEWKKLKVSDIDLKKGSISISATKRSNKRTIPLNPSQIGVLYEFIRNREERSLSASWREKLFINTPDVQKWTIKLRKLYPYFESFKQIRASIITYWIATKGLRKAQYYAGHRYISSTEYYLSNDLKSLKNDISQYHPI